MQHLFNFRYNFLKSFVPIFLLLGFCLSNSNSFGQLLINEISSDNQSFIADEDGDYEDWIEIFNSGAAPVNLNGYSLIDKLPAPTQWFFPAYVIQPGEFLLVNASGKNKKEVVHHWETAVKENDTWKYIKPSSDPVSNWRLAGFNDASWLSGKGGIGYGDGDDSTVITTPASSVFMRKTFTISDTSRITKAIFHMDYDDGFVAFLNGVEIARSTNLSGNPPGYNSVAEVEREAQVYSGGNYEKFVINHTLLKSIIVNGVNVLSVQVHNTNAFSSDMTSRPNLSFGIKDASILFSATPAWFNEPTSSFHTNFKLSKDGSETIYLFDNNSILLDQNDIPKMNINHSFGRTNNGNTWSYFNVPTPGSSNVSSVAYNGYCTNQLVFSVEGGFYNNAQSITISGSSNIRYTTDGSVPTISSNIYTSPISVTSTKVIRAACMSSNTLPEKIYTNTYFINENSTLPVISISTNPENFFDDNIGIYMLGPNADSNTIPYFGANFWQDWERPVHVEYYDQQKNLGFEQEAGVKIFGNYSRSNPMKSLWLKAHDRYGKDRFDYKFFRDKNIDSFKEIILRNSGNDFNVTHLKDAVNQMAVFKKTDIDIQAYQPCVVFINGQYWGVHQIREKFNEHYVFQNYGLDKNNVDVTDAWGGALHGDNNIWGLWWNAITLNLSSQANFKIVADSFDLDNMIDYFAAQIYISNWDWPQNNLKLWRPRNGDRKFRYIMYDTDISLGVWGLQPANFNQMGRIKNTSGLLIGPHSEIFSKMLNYIPFRNAFINRSADLMNTIYTPADFRDLVYRLRDSIAPEMPKHFNRWGSNTGSWAWNIGEMVDFINSRPAFARNQIQTEFSLVKQVNVTLNVSPAGAGVIKINSVHPATYPWTGVYFDGVPVTITAIPNPGFTFTHWQSPNLIPTPNPNKSVSINVTMNQTFTAYFSGSPAALSITVSEVNYHSSPLKDGGDWFELHNKSTVPIDISNWKFQDNKDYNCFTFPENSIIPAGGFLVVCSDAVKFSSAYPGVSNIVGSFGFDLSNDTDMIRIFDFKNDPILSFTYFDKNPWPVNADGQGYTLELLNGATNLNSASSWVTGCLYGSPGQAVNPSCILSVDDDLLKPDVLIHPIPSEGIVHLSFINLPADIYNYSITGVNGELILEGKWSLSDGSTDLDLNLTQLSSGIYFLSIHSKAGMVNKKLVKY